MYFLAPRLLDKLNLETQQRWTESGLSAGGPPAESTWSHVLREIMSTTPPDLDGVRWRKLANIQAVTGRPLVVYATACTIPNKVLPHQVLMLDFSDKLAFAEVTERLEGGALDVILHSAGGIAEAAEAIVLQLRRKFDDIRFIIPNFAKSAATMLAMSGNKIIMDPDAELGPIDPQMNTMFGTYPAESIIEQFEQAKAEILEDPRKVAIYGPILANLAPSLLVDCKHAIELSQKLVKDWLGKYMFAGDAEAESKALNVAAFLSDHAYFKSHARGVTLEDLQSRGVKATDWGEDHRLRDAVKEAYAAVDITLGNSPTVRLVENHLGNRVVRTFSQMPINIPMTPRTPPPRMP